MVKYYKHNKIIKFCTVLGALLGFLYCFFTLLNTNSFTIWPISFSINGVNGIIIGMIAATLTFLVTMKPDDPLPWHWLTLIVFGVLLFIFCNILPGILVFIGAIIGIIDDI